MCTYKSFEYTACNEQKNHNYYIHNEIDGIIALLKYKYLEIIPDKLNDLLDYKIHQIKKGDMVKIIYYDQMAYIQKEGKVAKIDLEYAKTIQIVDSVIPLKDIVFIEF